VQRINSIRDLDTESISCAPLYPAVPHDLPPACRRISHPISSMVPSVLVLSHETNRETYC
jgi:hypothetical protein